jgi:hypothetical protein
MLAWYQQWRHAGEENAVAIYSYSIGVELVAGFVVCAVFWLIFDVWADSQTVLGWSLILVCLLYLFPVVAKRRIAVIFTESHLIYRPALAASQRRLAGVRAIRKGEVNVPWEPFAYRQQVPGVLLELPYAQAFGLRLDLPHSDKIMQHLSDMTGMCAS